MCNESNKVVGFTKEVSLLLEISNRLLLESANKVSLEMLFPELAQEAVMKVLSSRAGGVLRLRYEQFGSEVATSEQQSIEPQKTGLVWVRILREQYAHVDAALMLLLSPVNEEVVSHYQGMSEGGLIE